MPRPRAPPAGHRGTARRRGGTRSRTTAAAPRPGGTGGAGRARAGGGGGCHAVWAGPGAGGGSARGAVRVWEVRAAADRAERGAVLRRPGSLTQAVRPACPDRVHKGPWPRRCRTGAFPLFPVGCAGAGFLHG
ncbi:hypothetical protein E2C11_18980 [Streptomyces lavendulae]|nr:hypothetical protein E2C11_18980 [Streptomyces lavendulae]